MSVLRIASWDVVPRTVEAGAVLVEIHGALPGAPAPALRRLAALDVPVVCSLSGAGDAASLAALLLSVHASAASSSTIDCSDARAVLQLGLTGLLIRAGAQRLLFGPQPVTAERLASHGLVEIGGDPAAVAERLAADPRAPLLVRSLRAASRLPLRESAEFDRELAELA